MMEDNVLTKRYSKLLRLQEIINKEVSDFKRDNVICPNCGYVRDFEEFFTKPVYKISGDDNIIWKCRCCDERSSNLVKRDKFEHILWLHGLTYEQWLKKYLETPKEEE